MSISFDHFAQLDIRVARVKNCEAIEGADRLYKLTLDVGDPAQGGLGERVVASGIKTWYTPDDLIDKQVVYLANLEPRLLRGVESQGMILAAGDETPVLLQPSKPLANGAQVR